MIGVAAESGVAPGTIWRIGKASTATSEFGKMNIGDSRFYNRTGELVLAELRITAGTRKTAHISKLPDAILLEEIQEILNAAVGVTDRPNGQSARLSRLFLRL